MSDFERVAAGMQGRVGAPWAGVAGTSIVFPPPRNGGVAGVQQVSQQSPSVYYTQTTPQFGGNSYMSLARKTAADNEVTSGNTRTFKRVPERLFRPLQFMAVSWVQDLMVVQMSMNNTNFMSHDNDSGMPITLISEVSQAMGINWADINTSNGVSSTIYNQGSTTQQFLAGFAGIQLDAQ